MARKPHVEYVYEGVSVVDLAELNLPADCGHAYAVAVGGDAGHNPLHQVAVLWNIERAEPKAVQARQRPGPHRENVPKDPSHAGCRALKGLDEGGVIMAFNLKDESEAVPDINNPGILTRPLQDVRPVGGQLLQMRLGALIGTMLGPHDGENAKFQMVRLPS